MEISIHKFDSTEESLKTTLLYITVEAHGELYQLPVSIAPSGFIYAGVGSNVKSTIENRIKTWNAKGPHKHTKSITL